MTSRARTSSTIAKRHFCRGFLKTSHIFTFTLSRVKARVRRPLLRYEKNPQLERKRGGNAVVLGPYPTATFASFPSTGSGVHCGLAARRTEENRK